MTGSNKSLKVAIVDVKASATMDTKATAINIRNAKALTELWGEGAQLFLTAEQLKESNTEFDAIILGFHSFHQDHRAIEAFVRKNEKAKVISLCNEYENYNNFVCQFAERKFIIVRNFEGKCNIPQKKLVEGDFFLNVNLLIAREPNELTEKKYDCIYYGTWRKNRASDFERYIQDIYLSSTPKNLKFYEHCGCRPKGYLDKLRWERKKETLNLFRYSLYIEDEYTHTHYNCLANRWYEAGFCNNVVFFDAKCENTIRKSEIGSFWEQIVPYIVYNNEELQEKIAFCNQDFNKHLAIQKSWRMSEQLLQKQMVEDLKKIVQQYVNEDF